MEERLNKWLESQMGVCSRREADRLIEGKVLVDNRPASMGQKTPGQKVVCNGKNGPGGPEQRPRPVLLAVNKPKGVVPPLIKDRAENIVDFLGIRSGFTLWEGWIRGFRGLLLMTNQGDLVNKIMRSGNAHEKEYIVTIDKPVTEHFLEQMAGGIRLSELDQVTRPCKVKKVDLEYIFHHSHPGTEPAYGGCVKACGCQVKRLVRVRITEHTSGQFENGRLPPDNQGGV